MALSRVVSEIFTFEYVLSTCAVVHTEIEYIILNIGTVRLVFYVYSAVSNQKQKVQLRYSFLI